MSRYAFKTENLGTFGGGGPTFYNWTKNGPRNGDFSAIGGHEKTPFRGFFIGGAEEGSRTPTPLRALDPESSLLLFGFLL